MKKRGKKNNNQGQLNHASAEKTFVLKLGEYLNAKMVYPLENIPKMIFKSEKKMQLQGEVDMIMVQTSKGKTCFCEVTCQRPFNASCKATKELVSPLPLIIQNLRYSM